MQIGRRDLIWNYAATTMRLLFSMVVLPITWHMLPTEEVGIWGIFISLMTITSLLDFGFSNSFSRNITYVYSGVKELKTTGYAVAETSDVDYGLLKNLLLAMKRYYGVMALIFLLVFVVGSPFYLSSVLAPYSGNRQVIWLAWSIFGGSLAYELYTYCYNAILIGRGLVKRMMQVTILSQSVRLIVTVTLLLYGFGLISLVLGLLTGNLVNRMLAHRAFYDRETKAKLAKESATDGWNTIKTLAPNSLKIGFISLSAYLRSYGVVLIAYLYLSLPQMAAFTISKQAVSVISTLGLTWYYTFYSQTAQYRVREDIQGTKRLYIKGNLNLIFMFVMGGGALLLFGSDALRLIKSDTSLLCNPYLFLMLLFSFLETRQVMAKGTLIAKNEVPFFKADIISGVCSVLVLLLMFHFTSLGVLSLIFSAGLVLCAYLNWKVPLTLAKEIRLHGKDYIKVALSYLSILKKVKTDYHSP